jgi:hypothetical protein
MATDWIEEPHREEWVECTLYLALLSHPSSGLAFDCDKDGKVTGNEYRTKAECEAHLAEAIASGLYSRPEHLVRERHWFNPGSLRCHCGAEHHLQRGDSTCEVCGQDYNACGQQLLPPHMWEEQIEEDY